jgi:hypothetical protein
LLQTPRHESKLPGWVLIGAIDKLNRLSAQITSLDFPSGILPPAFASHVFPDGIDRLETDALDKFISSVPEKLKDFQIAFNSIVGIRDADPAYQSDVSRIIGEHSLDAINGCMSQYLGALQDFRNQYIENPTKKLANLVMADPVRKCESTRQAFLLWRESLPERLKTARTEVENYL